MHTVPPRRLMLDEFLKVANANVIGQELKGIIEAEGPIARTLLAKRARRLYDLNRVTPKMEQHLELILNKVRPVMTPSADVPVYWPDGTDPQATAQYIADVLADRLPAPEPIRQQVAFILQLAAQVGA